MNSLASKLEVMQLLGTGLSVQTLVDRAGITFDQLCELAAQYPDLHHELKRWYKRYDFGLLKEGRDFVKEETTVVSNEEFTLPEPKVLETKEKIEETPKKRKKKVVAK